MMKNISNKLSYISVLTFLLIISFENMAYAATIEGKIDAWGNSALSILIKVLRWGGIFSLMGIGFFLYINKDEQGAKRGKTAFLIVGIATFIAFFAPVIYDQFVK